SLSLTWLYYGALSTAVSTLTGQSLGRRDLDGIRRLVARSIRMSIVLSAALGVPYWIWWAMAISIVFESVALLIWYRRDRWMYAKV
ncbi:MAG: hypothetical protein JRH17_20345, partial [Deltaproteobacteria bacterium]|nr:hypothetical protein [Deltaproteobacteria bacterium]